ncbi:hypothetical protein SEA_FRANSOYER_5 [Microbacterium phage Fransoyer]|nr:hypothetical protein SEA_FRANSOYER_5 [Microbacterium phage Fransoyer]
MSTQPETLVLQRGADGTYRLPRRPRRFIAFDPGDMRTPLLVYTVGDDGRLFTKEWIA